MRHSATIAQIPFVILCIAGPASAQTAMHMDMNHMTMTEHRPAAPGDSARAAAALAALRANLGPYKDYRRALADGYRIFLPRVPQPVYHFTNRQLTRAGDEHFDPAHPGSLLYQKVNDTTYRLVGAMYTAPKNATPDQLNAILPLSVATWHAHTNFCAPEPIISPAKWAQKDSSGHRLFGFRGSITTAEACTAAGGRFFPQVFGWMVHVYPFAPTWAEVWATDEVPATSPGMAGMSGMRMPPHT